MISCECECVSEKERVRVGDMKIYYLSLGTSLQFSLAKMSE